MTLSILAIHEAAEALLNCVCLSLDALPTEMEGLAGCPCRTCVVPGAPSADGCDGGCDVLPDGEFPGQLTVNLVRAFTSDRGSFPRELVTLRDRVDCAAPQVTALDLAITLWRCAPISSEQGCPPPCAELTASAMQLHADTLAIQRAVLCCYTTTDTVSRRGRRFALGATVTLGPAGGCVGLQTRVTVALDDTVGPIPVAPPVAPVGP